MEIRYDEAHSQCESTERILPRVIKVEESCCLLCRRAKKFYSCRKCAEEGDISFLTQLAAETATAIEKTFPGVISGTTKFKISQLQERYQEMKDLEKKASDVAALQKQRDMLATEIQVAKKRNQALKQLCRIQLGRIKDLQKEKKTALSSIEQLHRRSQRVRIKKTKITDYMNTKKYAIEKAQKSLSVELKQLEQLKIAQVRDLITHIFPLVGIPQDETYDSEESFSEENDAENQLNVIEEELAEARRLSFVHGRWIYDQREGPDLVRISIASSRVCAPADGNYTSCEAWLKSQLLSTVSENPETSAAVQQPEPHRSTGASVYAALCLATHLMHTVRKVLSIHMPYKLHYKQFSKPDMTVQEFLWNVHKLNGNVLALCLHYGVDPQLIHPLHTLPNIQNAVQMFLHNGEKSAPLLLTPGLVSSLEEALDESSDPLPDDDEEKLEESLSEWENSLREEDWESFMPNESESTQNQYASALPFQSQAQQDDMGQSQGLVSSAFSWAGGAFKGWWNR